MKAQFRKYMSERLKSWDSIALRVSVSFTHTDKDILRKKLVKLYGEVGK